MAAGQEVLYMKIYNYIKELIEAGELKPGDRIPTEMELAEKFQVSRITAIRAANELEKSGYVYRVRKRGTIVNPPLLYNTYPGLSQPIIPMIVPFGDAFGENIGFELLAGAQNEAQNRNCMLTVYNTNQDVATERQVLEKIADLNVFGIVSYPTDDSTYENLSIFSRILIKNTPLVFLDRPLSLPGVPCIASDNETGMYELVRRLLKKGHRKLGFYCDSLAKYTVQNSRFKGFCRALIEAGIELQNQYIFETHPFGLEYDELKRAGKTDETRENYCVARIVDRLQTMADPPSVLVCINDLSAVALQRTLIKRGLRIPEDISITGFDNHPVCNHLVTPLTSVSQNFYEIGKLSIQLLFDIKEGKEIQPFYCLPTQVVERESVALLPR